LFGSSQLLGTLTFTKITTRLSASACIIASNCFAVKVPLLPMWIMTASPNA